MGKMYRGCLCCLFAKNAGISFSYSCSMLDYSQRALRYRFVGWRPGTLIEQQHRLVLASTSLHGPLYSNTVAVGTKFMEFYGFFLYMQWVYVLMQQEPHVLITYIHMQEGLCQSLHQSVLLVFNENSIEVRSSDRLFYSNHDFSELAECKQRVDSQQVMISIEEGQRTYRGR